MPSQPGFWRKCQTGFRWFRVTVLFAVLALVCALVWFNRIGLPDFLKRRLVETLQTHGIELEFTRMRLHFVRGLVIENVRIGHAEAPDDPVLSLAEIQLQLNYRALLRRQWQVDGLILRQGKFVWPLTPTNGFTLGNIQTELRFQTNNTWSLDHFQADFAGAKLALSGDIIHAPEIRNWDIFHGKKSAGRAVWQARLRKFSDTLDRIHFTGTPQLSLVVDGDARDIHSFTVRLNLNATSIQTPWGGARDIRLTGNLTELGRAAIEPGRGRRRAGHSLVHRPAEPERDLDSNALGRRARHPAHRQPHRARRNSNPFRLVVGVVDKRAAISVDLDGEIQGIEIRKTGRGLRGVQRPLAGARIGHHQIVRRAGRRTT